MAHIVFENNINCVLGNRGLPKLCPLIGGFPQTNFRPKSLIVTQKGFENYTYENMHRMEKN